MQYRRDNMYGDTPARLIWRMVLAGVLSVALVLVGFGHRPVQAEPQVVAYLLAGGDWADLCGDGDAPHPAADACQACIIAQGTVLPDPACDLQHVVTTQPAILVLHQSATRGPRATAPNPARAPPLVDRSTFL